MVDETAYVERVPLKTHGEEHRVETVPKMRRFSLDAGWLGRRRHIVHALIQVDITDVRELIRTHERNTGETLSLTAWIISCLAAAAERHPHVHAYRDWRGRLVIFDNVNVNTLVEVEMQGNKVPMPHIIRAANRLSFRQVHDEIRATQARPAHTTESRFMGWFLLLPAFLRRAFYWAAMRLPHRFRDYSSSVMVTAVGMFGQGGGWGITMPNFTLTVTVGGIDVRPGVLDGRIEIREYLDLTVSIDHDIVDGAPFARFVNDLRQTIEDTRALSIAVQTDPREKG